jgi:hypothetical protein
MFDDLVQIGRNLSRGDYRELAATRDPDDFFRLAADAWESPIKKVVLDGDEPTFAFGAKPLFETDLATALVWGFKTPDGWLSIRVVTKYIRKFMIPELRALGVRHAICLVHRDNRSSQRWLSHLGFKPQATNREFGTLVLYRRDELDA